MEAIIENGMLNLGKGAFMYVGTVPGKEKVSLGICSSGQHLTITNNAERGVVNIHLTPEGASGGRAEHIFEMEYAPLETLLEKLAAQNMELVQQYFSSNTINLGKLKRHRLLVVSLDRSGLKPEDVFTETPKDAPKKIRLKRFVPLPVAEDCILLPEEVDPHSPNFHLLLSTKRGRSKCEGIIFRPASAPGRRFYHITQKAFNRYIRENFNLFIKAVMEVDFRHKEKFLQLLIRNGFFVPGSVMQDKGGHHESA